MPEDHHIEIDQHAIKAMAADPTSPIGQLIEQRAIAVETTAKFLTKLPGSGHMYEPGEYFFRRGKKVYHWTRTTAHRASAPGEPPAGDTGYLSAHIGHRMEVHDAVVGIVESKASYGLYLELGTRYMKPRPYLRPALSAVIK